MDIELFDYSPIVDRDPIHWPDGARVAFYVGLNIEHFRVDRPSTSIFDGTAALVPDAVNYGWRHYGARVAIWRLIDSRHDGRGGARLPHRCGRDHREGHRPAAARLDGAGA